MKCSALISAGRWRALRDPFVSVDVKFMASLLALPDLCTAPPRMRSVFGRFLGPRRSRQSCCYLLLPVPECRPPGCTAHIEKRLVPLIRLSQGPGDFKFYRVQRTACNLVLYCVCTKLESLAEETAEHAVCRRLGIDNIGHRKNGVGCQLIRSVPSPIWQLSRWSSTAIHIAVGNLVNSRFLTPMNRFQPSC